MRSKSCRGFQLNTEKVWQKKQDLIAEEILFPLLKTRCQLWCEERRQHKCHLYRPRQMILKNNSHKTHTVWIMSAPVYGQQWNLVGVHHRGFAAPHWATAAELFNSLDSYMTEDEMRKRRRRLQEWCSRQPGERKRLQALLKKAAPNGQEAGFSQKEVQVSEKHSPEPRRRASAAVNVKNVFKSRPLKEWLCCTLWGNGVQGNSCFTSETSWLVRAEVLFGNFELRGETQMLQQFSAVMNRCWWKQISKTVVFQISLNTETLGGSTSKVLDGKMSLKLQRTGVQQ